MDGFNGTLVATRKYMLHICCFHLLISFEAEIFQKTLCCQGINHHQGHPMWITPIGTMESPDIGQAIDWFAH